MVRIPLSPPRTKYLISYGVFDLIVVGILALVPGLCAKPATTVFAPRRIRAAFAAVVTRESRLRSVVVRRSLTNNRIRAGRAGTQRETIER